MLILAVDIGTTAMKMGIFLDDNGVLRQLQKFSQNYEVNIYNNGLFADIEQSKWQQAFLAECSSFGSFCAKVDLIFLNGTTPGLAAMDKNGEALYPAILMLDQRSQMQAKQIIDLVGLKTLLETTGNMPVAGGCSLGCILWVRENLPDFFRSTRIFGHTNTFMTRWLTGRFVIVRHRHRSLPSTTRV